MVVVFEGEALTGEKVTPGEFEASVDAARARKVGK